MSFGDQVADAEAIGDEPLCHVLQIGHKDLLAFLKRTDLNLRETDVSPFGRCAMRRCDQC